MFPEKHGSSNALIYFTKTGPNFLSFLWFQNLAVHTNTYMLMINLFWSIPHHFFHNAIAWPELNFIFEAHVGIKPWMDWYWRQVHVMNPHMYQIIKT